jgi:hypothetical protein
LAPWVDATATVMIARSVWHFLIDGLSDAERAKLDAAGEYTADSAVRKNAWNNIFRNKLSQETGVL